MLSSRRILATTVLSSSTLIFILDGLGELECFMELSLIEAFLPEILLDLGLSFLLYRDGLLSDGDFDLFYTSFLLY